MSVWNITKQLAQSENINIIPIEWINQHLILINNLHRLITHHHCSIRFKMLVLSLLSRIHFLVFLQCFHFFDLIIPQQVLPSLRLFSQPPWLFPWLIIFFIHSTSWFHQIFILLLSLFWQLIFLFLAFSHLVLLLFLRLFFKPSSWISLFFYLQ